jgi:hypothetical protein
MNTQNDINDLVKQNALLVRREASRAMRQLASPLCEQYDRLTDDAARRRFVEKNKDALATVGGLAGICLSAGKAFSPRARQEIYSTPTRLVTMRRFAFERLREDEKIAYVRLGGKIVD